MKRVQWSELATVAEDVRSGAEIEVLDGERVVAKVVPFREQTIAERIDELVAQGKARRGTGTLPDSFFTDPLLKFDSGSVVEQLLEDRRSKDY